MTTVHLGESDGQLVVFDRGGRVVWATPFDSLPAVEARRPRNGSALQVSVAQWSKFTVGGKGWIDTWSLRGLRATHAIPQIPAAHVELTPDHFAWVRRPAVGPWELYLSDSPSTPLCSCKETAPVQAKGCVLRSMTALPDRNELVVVDASNWDVLAVDLDTGETTWAGQTPGGLTSPPLGFVVDAQGTDAGTLLTATFVDGGSTRLRELAVEDDALIERWSATTDHAVSAVTPLADGGVLLSGLTQVVDLGPDGSPRWSIDIGAPAARVGRAFWIEDLYPLL